MFKLFKNYKSKVKTNLNLILFIYFLIKFKRFSETKFRYFFKLRIFSEIQQKHFEKILTNIATIQY